MIRRKLLTESGARTYQNPGSKQLIKMKPVRKEEADVIECEECEECCKIPIDLFTDAQEWTSAGEEQSAPLDLTTTGSVFETRTLSVDEHSGEFAIEGGLAHIWLGGSMTSPMIKIASAAGVDLTAAEAIEVRWWARADEDVYIYVRIEDADGNSYSENNPVWPYPSVVPGVWSARIDGFTGVDMTRVVSVEVHGNGPGGEEFTLGRICGVYPPSIPDDD